jgi:hypothetical protein
MQAIDVPSPFGIYGEETSHKPSNDIVTAPRRLHKDNVQRTDFMAPGKRPLAVDEERTMPPKKLRGNEHYNSHARDPKPKVSPTAAPKLLAQNADLYLGLPCMDCGEDVGHKWDCHIGSTLNLALFSYKSADNITDIKPARNLTSLDYRKFFELTEQFDPGPRATHQTPLEAAPDDPEIAILGMADVIRNEYSYKRDPELHSLPDATMILLWAFKATPTMELIRE